jgi:hypothetical protein
MKLSDESYKQILGCSIAIIIVSIIIVCCLKFDIMSKIIKACSSSNVAPSGMLKKKQTDTPTVIINVTPIPTITMTN